MLDMHVGTDINKDVLQIVICHCTLYPVYGGKNKNI